ncbi:MAG: cell wall-binding repeat-containing protein [Eggerthellaceae bacterium]|nr:cell wall-binding repeat-containing protein [Eggerthellaceae bacterium]
MNEKPVPCSRPLFTPCVTLGNRGSKYASVKFQPAVKFGVNKLGVSRADDDDIGWKDALAGTALCGRNCAVLVLGDDLNPAHAEAFVAANKANITYGYVFGGTSAVPKAVMERLVNASL